MVIKNKIIFHTPIIDQLNTNEQFEILIKSTGCFHNTSNKIVISRENNGYYASCKNSKRELNLDDLAYLREFQKKLNQKHTYGCTYIVVFDGKEQIVRDGSCSWNGFHKLKKRFGWDTI